MMDLAGILGMPLQTGLSGPAGQGGGPASPPGAFDALVAESVSADAYAESAPVPGATGHEADPALPTVPPGDRGTDALLAAVAAKALPGVTLPEVVPPEVVPPGAGLPGHSARVPSRLGTTDAPEPDAGEGREDDADETGSGWLLNGSLTPLTVPRDGPVTPAASGEGTRTQGPSREVPGGPPAWITGPEMEARNAVAVRERTSTAEVPGSSQPMPHAVDPGSGEPEAGAGERLPEMRSGLDPARQAEVAPPPAGPAPPEAIPAVAPPAHPVGLPAELSAAPQDAGQAEAGRGPYAARAGQTTAPAGKAGERAVPQGAGAEVPPPAAQTIESSQALGERGAPPAIPAASVAAVDRPAVQGPEAAELAVRTLDAPPELSGGPGDRFDDGSGEGQREGRQAAARQSHAAMTPAPALSGATPHAVAPAVVAAPAHAEAAQLAEDVGEGVNQQIVQSLRTQLRDGIGEAVVRLKPEHLGEVTISVRVERGAVEATVTAALPAVREWLEAQEPVVRQHLAEQGLSLTRLRVEPDGSRPDGGRAAQQERDQAQRRRPRPQAEPSARFDVVV